MSKPTNVSGQSSPRIEIHINNGGSRYPPYTGPTEATPDAYDEQVLFTKDKVLKTNITLHKVPYTEVSNPHGGLTARIAPRESEV